MRVGQEHSSEGVKEIAEFWTLKVKQTGFADGLDQSQRKRGLEGEGV